MKFSEVTLTLATFNDYELHIVFTDSIVRAERFISIRDNMDIGVSPTGARALHIMREGCWESYVVFKFDAEPYTLAHECWHVVHNILKLMGAGIENEVVAYLLTYLIKRVCEFQTKLKTRRVKNDLRRKHSAASKRGNRRRRKHNSTTKVRTTTKVRGGKARARQAN